MAEETAGCAGSIEDIRDRMRQAKDDPESGPFAVLLGAGASRSAGIPTATEMAKEVAADKYSEKTGSKPPADPEVLWSWLEEYARCKQHFEQRQEFPEALSGWAAVLFRLGHLVSDRGETQEAQALFEQAREKGQRAVELGRDRSAYNVACAEALLGNLDEAFEGLREVLENGWIEWSHVAQDEDWDDLRDEPRYRELDEEFGEADGGNEKSDNEGTDE